MNVVAMPRRTAGVTASPAGDREVALGVRLYHRLADAEADWRAVEASAVMTPYQRYDWIAALLASGLEVPGHVAIAIIHDGGRPVGVLPLALERHFGFTEARLIGTSLANGDWLAATAGIAATLTPGRLTQLLCDIGAAAGGVDLIRFYNQPASWCGIDNPLLALSSMPAPNNLYFASIAGAPLPYIEHRVPAKRRSNIRRGARRLEESFGRLALRRADNAEELDRQHRAFLAQRAERFAAMGVENLFGEAEFIGFFKALATTGFGQRRPALAFHALYAGDEIVATSIGTCQGAHYSQYINSTASGPAARYSLMGVLMAELLDELVRDGLLSLDMGAGDFDYKTDWTAPQPMFHSAIALTARGRQVKPLLGTGSALKRRIKQNPRLWGFAQTARRALYRLRHRHL
jgi:CelD/BcsL family acetyltransferase involved in cellulose biosynthesis